MMINNNKKHYFIKTDRLTLSPYYRKYVKQYNQWFTDDPELLYLTGSQLLTLQEQYQNHQTWIQDNSKYTFIILNNEGKMIGDVNLFFAEWIEPYQAEINIMIALKNERGKGYAGQILRYLQAFVLTVFKKQEMIAKIKEDNLASQKLFLKNGYKLYEHHAHFQQIQYRKTFAHCEEEYKQLLSGKMTQLVNKAELFEE